MKRKLIVMLLAMAMLLALIPVISVTALEPGEGLWTTIRESHTPGMAYRPATGYHYTSAGCVISGADFSNTAPLINVESKEAVNIKDGLYMEIIIDEFSYRGLDGKQDEWIAFNLWSTEAGFAGGGGEGYVNLLRSGGSGGNAGVENYLVSTEKGMHNLTPGPNVTPKTNLRNKEVWSFAVTYDDVAGYSIWVNDTLIWANSAELNEHMDALSQEGNFYVGVSLMSTEANGVAAITVSKYGNSKSEAEVPTGDDSKEAEENPNREYLPEDFLNPDDVPANTPALLWDATTVENPIGTSLRLEPQGNDAYRASSTGGTVHNIRWHMDLDVCVDAYDFPVFAMLVSHLYCGQGELCYGAGEVVLPGADQTALWDQYSKDTPFYVDDDGNEYALILMDLTDRWSGRINMLGINFNQLDTSTDDTAWFDVMYMGLFRSVEEAVNYTETRYGDKLDRDDEQRTEAETESETETESESATETGFESEPDVLETESQSVETESKTATETETQSAAKSGCSGVMGTGAVALLLSAMAAAVALKKKA